MSPTPRPRPSSGAAPRVVVVGAGAAGSLTALHLARAARARATALEVELLDPAPRWARGVAFGTDDEEHLLNVPAAQMSVLGDDPGHFVAWLEQHGRPSEAQPHAFVPRRRWAAYLDACLSAEAGTAAETVRVRHRHLRATALTRTDAEPGREGRAWTVRAGAEDVAADAVVLATGAPADQVDWAPASLRASPFLVVDPWAPGALDVVRRDRSGPADVLVVGSGLTMLDVTLTVVGDGARPDRRVLATSRRGRVPHTHRRRPALPVVPDVSTWDADLDAVLAAATAHLRGVEADTGDWRPGADGLRHRVTVLWDRLGEEDRHRFLDEHQGAWNVLRHRAAPVPGEVLEGLLATDRVEVRAVRVQDAEPLPHGGLRVRLDDGTTHDVGWVVNATGGGGDVRRSPDALLRDLLRDRAGLRLAEPATRGLGVRTVEGRLRDSDGTTDAPVWTLGSLRRGELLESTAIPEIRSQAQALAGAVLDEVAPLPRRLEDGRWVGGHHPVARPRDLLGLPLSTTAEAAATYNAGLERVLRLQSGGETLIAEAVALDPDLAVGHAALALLGHEGGAEVDVSAALAAARSALARRGDERERSFVAVVGARVGDASAGTRAGAAALTRHVSLHPRDALAVSAAVPTIAFSGVTDLQREAWELVEGLAPAYGDHWWYHSLLAFTRQDQGRLEEAGLLAESALACEPASGHAVHALTHVFYETGEHEAGLAWLDGWIGRSGRDADHRAHFSWHAALHELTTGDLEAVRRRYYRELAPPTTTGMRLLVDAVSLLWRWELTTAAWPGSEDQALPSVESALAEVDPALLARPGTPFGAVHAAVALAAAGRHDRLDRLRRRCRDDGDPVLSGVVAPLCEALAHQGAGRYGQAADLLLDLLPRLVLVGGSAAQREVVEEALLLCLARSGRPERAATLLDRRLDRRPSALDVRRLASLRRVAPAPAPGR
ncbi:FAD/NAD(P)-binding protein [Nocardioides bruguierae]|uniref:FAD/NAD(P)-binding protein n=1 Tax=Nocardioides bruguierae TaxID=2945102 RepID=A0A9X2IE80_9ACTN|nr:FAD/NAD(P)-binding protein [Nocardioides bruguierae]MCM0619778.1 FAD/NAD(P)-binding protein [Nocardioides bruguierae]